MKKCSTFGECLTAILNALDLKCSKLAKEISVDPSLVYKWLRGERIPSYDTPYIELISSYIAGKIINNYQMESILDLLGIHQSLEVANSKELQKNIRIWLQEAQGYSLKLKKKKYPDNVSSASAFPHRISKNHRVKYGGNSALLVHHDTLHKDLVHSYDHIHVIQGHKDVVYSLIRLLRQAQARPVLDSDKILITFNSGMDILLDDMNLRHEWTKTFHSVLSHGWHIILLIRLNSNTQRTVKIIEDLQTLLSPGSLTIYYKKTCDEISIINELCIVPHVGALFCFSSKLGQQADRAFLYHDKASLDTLTAYFFQHLTFAKPLLTPYSSQKTVEFQQLMCETEEVPGDRYVLKNGFSTITLPLNLYEKYLHLSSKTHQEISYRYFLHKRRLESFESQVKHYEFKDICFIESLEQLVATKKYSFDEYYVLEDKLPHKEDIICHLENITHMLKTYDNYKIAFVSMKDFSNLADTCWSVKENLNVLIGTQSKSKNLTDNCSFNPDMNFVATEKSIVTAFNNYFQKKWTEIPEAHKNKKASIQLLQSMIDRCKAE